MKRSVLAEKALLLTAALMMSTSATTLAADAMPQVEVDPPGLAAAYLGARHAEMSNDTALAVSYFNFARGLDPDNNRLVEESYFLATQMGDFTQALAAAKRAYATNPRRGISAVLLAADAYKRKDYNAAWGFVESIPAQSINSFALPVLRAWTVAPLQPAEVAIAELALLKNFQDTVHLVDLMSGLLNEYYGHQDAALANYGALAADIETRRPSILRIVAGGYHRLGRSAQAKDLIARYETAHGASPLLDAMATALDARQARRLTPQEGLGEALLASSELLLQTEPNMARMQVATAYAQTALFVNPQLTAARVFLGAAFAARDSYEESNAMLAAVTKQQPGYLEARMQMADNLTRMDRADDALSVLRDVLKERPEWSDVHIAIGDLLRRQERYAEAIDEYTAALKLRPAQAPENWALHYTRGISYERMKNWSAAERDFKRALEIRPEEPSVLNYLGYSYLDRGENLKEARRLIELAYTKRPDDGYIIDSLGWMLFTLGEYDQAVLHLEKAVEAAPADATINEHLGDAYWQVGRRTEARYQWQRALTLDVEDAQRAVIHKKLEQGLARN